MSKDVEAQGITGGVLRPSGRRNLGRSIIRQLEAIDTGNERAQELVQRRMNWGKMSAAQKQEWLLDAVTFLLAVDVRERMR